MNSKLILPLLLLNLLAPLGRGAEFDIKVDRLSPRVAVLSGDPWGNAIVAVATPKGIVVVDAPFSRTIAGGFVYKQRRNTEAAIVHLKKALEIDPEQRWAKQQLAELQSSK